MMLRNIILILFALFLTTTASATSVHILQINLESWFTMDPKKSYPPIKDMTIYMKNGQFDFIATQENDYLLTDPPYGLSSNYQLAGNRNDASIFYDTSRWTLLPGTWKSLPMTSDGGGGRVVVFAQFKNTKSNEVVTIATTHLCVNWGKGDCKNGGEINSHLADARQLGNDLQPYTGPIFLTGDFNSLADSMNQAISIEKILDGYNLKAVKSGNTFIGPTFQNSTIDFVYSRNATFEKAVLYTQAQGNHSDHSAIDVTFNINDHS